MNRRAKEIVGEITKMAKDALFDFDNVTINDNTSVSADIETSFDFGNCEVRCYFFYKHQQDNNSIKHVYVELLPNNDEHSLERIEQAVDAELSTSFNFGSYLHQLAGVREDEEDEFTANGFRDMSDYMNWRYA